MALAPAAPQGLGSRIVQHFVTHGPPVKTEGPSPLVGPPPGAAPPVPHAVYHAFKALGPPSFATTNTQGVGVDPGQNPQYPDFMDSPIVLGAVNEENLGMAQEDAALRSAREQAIIRFGDPALASMAGFGLDPQAAAFAHQNYLSGNADLARIDESHKLAHQAIINRLAGHGILQSGDLGYLEGQEGQQYSNSQYDARNKVLDYLSQLTQSDLAKRQQLRNAVNQALQTAYLQYISNPAYQRSYS